MKASKGPRRRTRQKLRKRPRDRGPPPVTRSFLHLEPGEKAAIVIDPSVPKGQPDTRFHGLTGTVVERRGRAYVVAVRQGGLTKQVIATPEHLRKVE